MPAKYIGSPGVGGGDDDGLLQALMQKRQLAGQERMAKAQRPHWTQTLSQALMGTGQQWQQQQQFTANLDLQKARLKAEKAQLDFQEKQFTWQQGEAVQGRKAKAEAARQEQLSTLTGKRIEQQTEYEKLYAPRFILVGNSLQYADPRTGEAKEAAYVPKGVILKYEERLVDEGTGQVMAESEDVMQDQFYIYGIKKGKLATRARKIDIPEGTYGVNTPEGNIEIRDLESDKVVDRIMTADPAKATMAQMMEAEARRAEVEYGYIVGMGKIDAAKEMNWLQLDSTERIEATKRVGENLDRALDEKRVTIEAGHLVLDRDKMMQEAKTEEEKQQLNKYLGELQTKLTENVEQARITLGYAGLTSGEFLTRITLASKEKVAWWEITSTEDIADLDRAVDLKAIHVTEKGIEVQKSVAELLELGRNERAELERNFQAELAVDKNKLARLDFAVRLKAITVTEKGIKINDATARLLELGRNERAEFDRQLTAQMEAKKTELGYAGLSMKEIVAKMEQETEMVKVGAKREADEKGEAREETEHLMALMTRATGQIKSTFGVFMPEDRALAAGVLITLIETDQSLSPETKARWLQIAPPLLGVTMAEMIDPQLGEKYGWMRDLWNDAIAKASEKAGLPPPSKTYKGVSLEEIIREVDRLDNNKAVKKYLKKFGLTLDEYRKVSQEWLTR